jgi:hypothetical protein
MYINKIFKLRFHQSPYIQINYRHTSKHSEANTRSHIAAEHAYSTSVVLTLISAINSADLCSLFCIALLHLAYKELFKCVYNYIYFAENHCRIRINLILPLASTCIWGTR